MVTVASLTVRSCPGLAVLVLAGAAPAQNSWAFEISYSDPAGVINSPDDSARVTLWASWDPKPDQNFAFGWGALSVTADDPLDLGSWSDPTRLLKGPGSKNGIVDGESVTGIAAIQWYDFFAGIYPDDSNPIAAWSATWRTESVHPRTVPLTTLTTKFGIWQWQENLWDGLPTLIEGFGAIHVVPAPGILPLGAAASIAAKRRR